MKKEIKNCLGCGRDTKNNTGLCYRCSPSCSGMTTASQSDERRDRKIQALNYELGGFAGE